MRWLAPIALLAAIGAVLAVVLNAPNSCEEIDYAGFRADDRAQRAGVPGIVASRVARCGSLYRESRATVTARLGAPDERRAAWDRWYVRVGDDGSTRTPLQIGYQDGVVVDVDFGSTRDDYD